MIVETGLDDNINVQLSDKSIVVSVRSILIIWCYLPMVNETIIIILCYIFSIAKTDVLCYGQWWASYFYKVTELLYFRY
jgi:hypothetical protein